jgi:hypothetical protein
MKNVLDMNVFVKLDTTVILPHNVVSIMDYILNKIEFVYFIKKVKIEETLKLYEKCNSTFWNQLAASPNEALQCPADCGRATCNIRYRDDASNCGKIYFLKPNENH